MIHRKYITRAGIFLAGLLLLTGFQRKGREASSEEPVAVTGEAQGEFEQKSAEGGSGEKQTEKDVTIEEETLEKQLKVILAQQKQWKYDYREKDNWCYEGAECYQYMISDLDQNGRVEIFCQTYQGNGDIPINDYFEVNENLDGLEHITLRAGDEDYADFED